MRISTRGRYSLEALLFLALLPEERYASTREISAQTGISDGYLEQLFIPLKKAGIIRGIRGPTGGYLPGRNPELITVGDILRSVEGSLAPVACIDSGSCPSESECLSRHTWDRLYREISSCIDGITLADLAAAHQNQEKPEFAL